MPNLVENPIRITRYLTTLAAVVCCLNATNERTSNVLADEISPIPSPTPRPFEGRGWEKGNVHVEWYGNYELSTIKLCGGEDINEDGRQAVAVHLKVDNLQAGQKPELEVWDYRNTPAFSTRYPANVEIVLGKTSATFSKELSLGRYSFFVRIGDNVVRLADQSIFECQKPLDLKLFE